MTGPLLAGLAGVAGVVAQSAPETGAVQVWITAEPAGAGQVFVGHVRAPAAFQGRYELIAERTGSGGRSSTRQGGSVILPVAGERRLSRAALSPLGPEDSFSVVLNVLKDDAVVATAALKR